MTLSNGTFYSGNPMATTQRTGKALQVAVEGGALAGRATGPANAPVVLLVHGYPDTRRVWRLTTQRLAHNHRVVSYDVRGAGDSYAPRRLGDYALPCLTADLGAVADAVSPDRPVHLVGHDWGAIQGWEAVTDPALAHRFASFTAIAGPCLDHVGHWFRERLAAGDWRAPAEQFRRSWYIGAFQVPWLPSLAWRLALGRRWPSLLESLENIRTRPDPAQAATGRRGTALYRANMLPRLLHPGERRTEVPVQTVLPTRDRFVGPALMDSAAPWIGRRRRLEVDAGHWLPLSHPDWLAARIGEFAAQADTGTVPTAAACNDIGRLAAAAPDPR